MQTHCVIAMWEPIALGYPRRSRVASEQAPRRRRRSATSRASSRELRERADVLAEAMAKVFADDDDQQVELPVAEHRPDG